VVVCQFITGNYWKLRAKREEKGVGEVTNIPKRILFKNPEPWKGGRGPFETDKMGMTIFQAMPVRGTQLEEIGLV